MRSAGGLQSVPSAAPHDVTVIACAISVQQRARLADATRGRANLRMLDSFDQLRRSLRSTIDDVDIVVARGARPVGSDAVQLMRELVAERPRVAIVAYCQAGSQYSADLRALAAAGVHQFVFNGIDDTGVAFRAVLDAAQRHCGAEWVMRQLAPIVPAALHPMVEATLTAPDLVTNVPTLAAALRVHRKTLFNRCERAGFLAPAELVTWTRLALVAYLLETTGCSVETIALQLSYPSDTSLRNAMKRYTGHRASEIRERGGIETVVRALRRRVNAPRHARRDVAPPVTHAGPRPSQSPRMPMRSRPCLGTRPPRSSRSGAKRRRPIRSGARAARAPGESRSVAAHIVVSPRAAERLIRAVDERRR